MKLNLSDAESLAIRASQEVAAMLRGEAAALQQRGAALTQRLKTIECEVEALARAVVERAGLPWDGVLWSPSNDSKMLIGYTEFETQSDAVPKQP